MDVAGKVALITGAAKGLGKEFCRVLLNKGAKVCVADVDLVTGKQTVEEFHSSYGTNSAFFVKCDVSKRTDLENAFEETKTLYGHIDIVCNNAGIIQETQWEKAVAINLNGVIHGSQLAMKYMAATEGGRGGVLINVASMAGISVSPAAPVYTATKHAVLGYTRSLAMEYRRHRVRTNCICPGHTDTDILKVQPGDVLDEKQMKMSADVLGLQSVDVVGRAFLSLVEGEHNCTVLTVYPGKGAKVKPYRDLKYFPNARL